MFKKLTSGAALISLGLLLAAPAAWGDTVEYTDSGFTINDVSQPNLLNPPPGGPPGSPSGNNNSVWNNTPLNPSGNQVTVNFTSGGSISEPTYVLGGFSDLAGAEVSNNTVTLNSGTVISQIYGGYSVNGNVLSNTVQINGGASTVLGSVYGGHAITGGTSVDNTVIMSGGTVNIVYGGSSGDGEVKDNAVIINGGTVDSAVYGGATQDGEVRNNTVSINGGTVNDVYGGYSVDGAASNNQVTIDSGTVGGGVVGGYSYNINATGNTVSMSGGTVGGICGGLSDDGNATGNTVNIYGGGFVPEASLHGGVSWGTGADMFSNNTLNLHTSVSVARVGNFENYNFHLPGTIKNNEAMLTVTGFSPAFLAVNPGLSNTDTDINNSKISVGISAQAPALQKNDVIHLIKVQTPGYALTGTPLSFTAQQGLTMLYEVQAEQTADAYSIRVLNAGLRPQTKAFSEGYAAGAAFVGQGADLLAGQGLRALSQAAAGSGWAAFGALQGGKSSYSTGSSVEVKGMSLVAGLANNLGFSAGTLALGAFVEGGFGDYNSYNSFSNAAGVEGNGDTSYVGGGIMGRFGFNNGLYSEASLRLGHTETDFGAAGINDSYASYDSSGMYWGGHLGLGYVFAVGDAASLDVYAKYLFTWVKGDTVRLNSGEDVEFDNVCSQRGRIGARLSYAIPQLTPYVGAAYDYEFDGDVSARSRGFAIAEPSLSGGTGIFEVGFNWRPVTDSAWSFDLGLEGYVGTREGISGGFKINYEF